MKFKNAIFDMDGTLWDAVDSYARLWNIAAAEFGITATVTRGKLLGMMGMTIDRIFNSVYTPGTVDERKFMPVLERLEEELMPVYGGTLYPGVKEGIRRLSEVMDLYMVSNCGKEGLRNFLKFTELEPYFKGTLTYGETYRGKAFNIRKIIADNSLADAVYIGDTDGDCKSAHEAGIPMIHAAYGFGTAADADFHASSFNEVVKILIDNHE